MNLVVAIPHSEAQKHAGNYKKHHLQVHGLDISIENPRGSVRSGTDKHGKRWQSVMTAHYGYIRGTNGNDDEQIDIFIGPDLASEKVFIINQVDPDTGKFDEHKSILGVNSEAEARALYLSNYAKGWQGLGSIKEKSVAEFKDWLKNGKTEQAIKAIRDLPLLPSKKNPMVMRHQVVIKHDAPRNRYIATHPETKMAHVGLGASEDEARSDWVRKVNIAAWEDKIKDTIKQVHGRDFQLSTEQGWREFITAHERALATIGLSMTRQQIYRMLTSDKHKDVWHEAEYAARVAKPIKEDLTEQARKLGLPEEIVRQRKERLAKLQEQIRPVKKAMRDLPLMPSKKNPAVKRHQLPKGLVPTGTFIQDDGSIRHHFRSDDGLKRYEHTEAEGLKLVGTSYTNEESGIAEFLRTHRQQKGISLVFDPTALLRKDIITTPKMPGSSKMDWGAVPVGASVWITITDPESPLHGRHILITKRADNQAVMDPGEARRHGYKMGSWADEAAGDMSGMAHATFQMGQLKEQRRDVERWAAYEARRAERAPFEAKLREFRGEASSKQRELEGKYLQSVGISKYGLTKIEKKIVADSATKQATEAGVDQDLADAYGKTVGRMRDQMERRFQRDAALKRLKVYQKALDLFAPKNEEQEAALRDLTPEEQQEREQQQQAQEAELQALAQVADRESQPLEVEAPDIPMDATTPQEVEHAVVEDFTKKMEQARKRREENEELREEARKDAVIIRATREAEDAMAKLLWTRDAEAAKTAVEAFQGLQQARAETAEIKKIIPPKLPRPETAIVATALEQLRLKAVEAVDEEKVQEAEKRYRESSQLNLDESFYAVVHEHWNDEVGYAINGGTQDGASEFLNGILKRKKGFVSGAASSALTALVGKHTGIELDIGRLAAAFSPDVTAAIVGHWLVGQARTRQLKGKSISAIVAAIEEDNRGNLLQMEKLALAKDKALKETYEKIKQQKNNGELAFEATIMRAEAENILQRRENMGRAFGSLSASGSLLMAMKHAQGGIDEKLSINVGSSRENAERILKEALGVNPSKIPPEIKITHNILGTDKETGDTIMQYQISSNANFLAQRWGRSAPILNKDAQELNRIKANDDEVTSLDTPPHFRQEWINEAGVKEPFRMFKTSRNDINWLRKMGGGLITRATGAGKTLSSTGYISHLLKENPNSKHLVIVPDGLTAQWQDQIGRATTIPHTVIPEKKTKEERQKFWSQVKNGSMVIVSHSDALKAQMDIDAIVGHGFHSCIIDEPQNLKSQTSEKLGTAAKRIINIPFKHRVALSASPARESIDEIYEWANWASKEHIGEDKRGRARWRPKIGSKVGFGRMFAGIGSGTNAQDESAQNLLFSKLSPYMSGDEIKNRQNYKVVHNTHNTQRTPAQIEKQKQIEAGGAALEAKIRADETVKAKRMGKNKLYVEQRTKHLLMKEMQRLHWNNLHGGEDNGKSQQIADNIDKHIKEGRITHGIMVDSDAQRVSVGALLRKKGYKNIYDLTELNKRAKFKEQAEEIAKEAGITLDQAHERVVARRKQDWGAHQEKNEPSIMFLDKTSQAGHNLQKGQVFSQAGRPQDAAGYYQGIGRFDRPGRMGDVTVDNYRYTDSPFEDSHWQEFDTQKKIVGGITPALVKSVYAGVVIKSLGFNLIKQKILGYFGL